jgi:8-oxo-dGTP diphosphatase
MAVKVIRPCVVLIKDNKILVLKSKYSSGEFYLLPGGGIEGMESLKETAIRETKEETNYDIEIKKLLYLQEWIDEKSDKNVLTVVFLGKIIGGKETHLNDPALEKGNIKGIEWIDIKELNKLTLYPVEIIPLLQKDHLNNLKNGGIYI